MSHGETIAALLGRLVLGWFFLVEAYSYGTDWDNTVMLLSMKDLPLAQLVLAVSLPMIVLSSLSLILGFHTRVGALTLFLITIAATVTVHDYWVLTAPVARAEDFSIFSRNIAIAAGLLLLIGMGAGKFALDNARQNSRRDRGSR